nr:MAG TPA: hypothetical protein [Caudoviricetes sp.]
MQTSTIYKHFYISLRTTSYVSNFFCCEINQKITSF